jgi:hypothetical protein
MERPETGRLPLARSSCLAAEAGSYWLAGLVCRSEPRTLVARRESSRSSSPNGPPRKATPRSAACLSARSAPGGRCVYPTSAIDIRNEHPTDRAILGSRRAEASFDDEPPASALSQMATSLPVSKLRPVLLGLVITSPPERRSLVSQAFSAVGGVASRLLTSPVVSSSPWASPLRSER